MIGFVSKDILKCGQDELICDNRFAEEQIMRVLILIAAVLLFPVALFASEEISVSVTTPDNLVSRICPNGPLWKSVTASLGSIEDFREKDALGILRQRSKEPVDIVSTNLKKAFADGIKALLTGCGITLTKKSKATPEFSFEIREFWVDMEKRLVTERGEGKASVVINIFRGPSATESMTVNYKMEIKSSRKQGTARLEELLSDLLVGLLTQVSSALK